MNDKVFVGSWLNDNALYSFTLRSQPFALRRRQPQAGGDLGSDGGEGEDMG